MMYRKYILKLSCLMVFLLLSTGNALAHKVTVFAWVEGDTVLGESKFSGGKKAQNAEIIVWDLTGKELLRTRTNEKGEFSFPIPKKTAMRIELIAGMGHKGEWTIPLEDFGETVPAENTREEKVKSPEPAVKSDPEPIAQTPSSQTPSSIDATQLESIVEKAVTKALNQKITPLTKMVADLEQQGPSMSEIFGGIGYIFGLMGVAIYFSSRRKK